MRVVWFGGATPSPSAPMAARKPDDISTTDSRMNRLTSGYFLGPVPITHFMQHVMPLPSYGPEPNPRSSRNPFDKVWRKSRKLDLQCRLNMIRRFITAAKRFVPSCVLRAQLDKWDPLSKESVDVGFYESSNASPNLTDFADLELFLSVNPDEKADPFNDTPTLPRSFAYPFERPALGHAEIRARIAAQASAMLNLQPRLHLFSLLLSGPMARIIRWDAAGALVTESFPYATTSYLFEFLARFDRLDPEQRGYDPSITRIDEAWPTTLAPPDVLTRLKSLKTSPELPRHRYFGLMKIPDRFDASLEYDFLVSLPFAYDKTTPFGRSTRPMLAYDVTLEKVVFAKQYWRVNSGPYVQHKEGDIYSTLEDHEVRHLPVFGRGNDVRNVSTLTDVLGRCDDRTWGFNTQALVSYRLYRMTLQTIGRKLTEFTSARELVSAMRDAMQCHDDAYFKANILHRDISSGNIMINVEDGSGFLTDWDSCLDMNTATEAQLTRRMGTWEFMSSQQLSGKNKPYTLADDRESALWVLTWVALKYCPLKSDRPLSEWLSMFTQSSLRDPFFNNGPLARVGGRKKIAFILGDDFRCSVEFQLSPCLLPLICFLKGLFECRYRIAGHLDPGVRRLEEEGGLTALSDRLKIQLDNLSLPNTVLHIFDIALDISEGWSEQNDPAIPNQIHTPDPPAHEASVTESNSSEHRPEEGDATHSPHPRKRRSNKPKAPPRRRSHGTKQRPNETRANLNHPQQTSARPAVPPQKITPGPPTRLPPKRTPARPKVTPKPK